MKKHTFLTLLICFSIFLKTFSQNEQDKRNDKSFSFKESFHSFGFSVFNGINFAPKIQNHVGEIKPILYHSYVPEFILQYNFMIKNGFGFSLEVPFGVFSRKSLTKLSDYGASNDVTLYMGSPYIGFIGKLTIIKELNKNICMQGELGVKFNPFFHPADQWDNKEYDIFNTNNYEIEDDNSSINFPKIEQKYYAIPDVTTALLFFFHSEKNLKNNFVLGLNVSLSFVKRIKIDYDTRFSELGLNNSSFIGLGNYGWNSTAIGITIGYRFFGVK